MSKIKLKTLPSATDPQKMLGWIIDPRALQPIADLTHNKGVGRHIEAEDVETVLCAAADLGYVQIK